MKNLSDFTNEIIPIEKFSMKWRFTEEKYDVLPNIHLNQLKPLSEKGANFIWNHVSKIQLHKDYPFQNGLFRFIETIEYFEGKESYIRKWLYRRAIPFNENCFLSWQPNTGMVVPWKIFIKYFDSFNYYNDQLTLFNEDLSWSIVFDKDKIYWGTNKNYRA